jgi:ribose transport system permease protein
MAELELATPRRNLARKLADQREFVLVVIILGVVAGMAVSYPEAMTSDNLAAVFLSLSFQAIIAIGMTNLLVSGGFDLSVGSAVGLTGAIASLAMLSGLPVPLAILLGLAVGAAIGLANGVLIAKVGINPFVTTLGMMLIIRGLLEVIAAGGSIAGLPASFKWIGQDHLLGVQYPILICLSMVILGDLLLRRSRFFRQNYYIGGSEKAALLSGISVDRMRIFNYALTGLLAAVAGILTAARFNGVSATTGKDMELKVITAVIIGGASLQGGEGTVLGALLGCLLMSIITSSTTIIGIDVKWNTFIIGATLLAAVLIDVLSKRKRSTA